MSTRKDLYLKKLNDGTVAVPTPTTTEEKILAGLAGTGGLGIELPEVTASDNGKILMVVNGEWTLADAPSQLPSVTASDNGKVLKVVGGQWVAYGEVSSEGAIGGEQGGSYDPTYSGGSEQP